MINLRIALAALTLTSYVYAAEHSIDDVSPSCSPTGFTKACQPGGGFFGAFPGEYNLALKIGDRLFNDKLKIAYITRHPGMMNFAEVIAGQFSSPEAKLYAPIRNGKIMVAKSVSGSFSAYEMAFDVLINENNKKYTVYFHIKGNSMNPCTAQEGVAYLDPVRTQILGKFIMTKNTNDCACAPN